MDAGAHRPGRGLHLRGRLGAQLFVWLQNVARVIATDTFRYLQRSRILNWVFTSRGISVGQVANLFGEATHQAGEGIRYIHVAIVQVGTSALLAAALFYLSPKLTLMAFGILLVLAKPVQTVNRRIRKAGTNLIAEWDSANRRLLQSTKNLLLLRIYDMARVEEAKAQKNLKSYLGFVLSASFNNVALAVIPQALGITLICLLIYESKSSLTITAGTLLSYFYLFIRFLQNASLVGQAYGNAVFQIPQLKNLMNWWEQTGKPGIAAADAKLAESRASQAETTVKNAIGWNVDNVSFTYTSGQKEFLQNLSFKIKPGTVTVILGPSGVGKSTLLGLLLGDLEPVRGAISLEIDGGLKKLSANQSLLLHGVGYVGAESFLIEGTIRQNLLYGIHGDRSPDEIRKAIAMAECQFIDELPLGLEHRITDQGEGISAGQKQRLSLARALLRRPKVLILDEATANLDVATEERLVQTLTGIKGQLTIVAVTHRQSLTRLADQTLVLKEGSYELC